MCYRQRILPAFKEMGGTLCRSKIDGGQSATSLSPEWDLNVSLSYEGSKMSKSEIKKISSSWEIVKAKEVVTSDSCLCLVAFKRLFEYYPTSQSLFFSNSARDFTRPDDCHKYPLFMSHVTRVFNSISMTIGLLEDQYSRDEYLKNLEAFHHQLFGLKKDYIAVYMKILDDELEQILSPLYEEEVKRSFRKLFTIIYSQLTWRVPE